VQFGSRAEQGENKIPRPADEKRGARDDATLEKIQTVPVPNHDSNRLLPGRASLQGAHGAEAPPPVDCGGMHSAETTRDLVPVAQEKARIRTILFLLCVAALGVFLSLKFSALLKGSDFPDFYCAARMLAEGHGHQLYDANLQRQYQARYSGRVGTLYIHPPFEAAVYLAVAWLPLSKAYLLWFWLNLIFLGIGACLMAREELLPWCWTSWLALSLTFVPVLLCLQQGQDSILLLLSIILGFAAWKRERPYVAGCWLGLGLFKFQLALPLILALLFASVRSSNRGKLAKGFGLTAVALAAVSAAISGWRIFVVYPQFLIHLQALPFAGIVPDAMANFRGLVYWMLQGRQSTAAAIITMALSAGSFIYMLNVWRRGQAEDGTSPGQHISSAFSSALLFAILVSYHLNPHDLSLLLIPFAILLEQIFEQKSYKTTSEKTAAFRWVMFSLMVILFLPPLHVWALPTGRYAIIALPVFILFLAVTTQRQKQPR
jgi:hypothetical protein